MPRFFSILLIIFFLNVQGAVEASNVENSQSLIQALRGPNFHRLNFEVPANDLRFTSVKGTRIDLRQLQGKMIFLSFWTVDSPQWINEMRRLETLQSRYGKQEVQVIALNLVDPIQKIKLFLAKNPTKLLVAFDPDHSLNVSAKKFIRGESSLFVTDRNAVAIYEIPEYPTTYIIDKDGRTLGFFVGRTDCNMGDLDNLLATLSVPRDTGLSRNSGQFQTDAKQGISSPPKAPVLGGPTKRGPTQAPSGPTQAPAPLGPQAPIPVPDTETQKSDANSLPFKGASELPVPVSKPTEATASPKPAVKKGGKSIKTETDMSHTKQKKSKRIHQSTTPPVRQLRTNKAASPRKHIPTDPFAESRGKP
ncbi:MAG: redoxin domain-containing protein, partial [Desulfomonilaceae bacterium]